MIKRLMSAGRLVSLRRPFSVLLAATLGVNANFICVKAAFAEGTQPSPDQNSSATRTLNFDLSSTDRTQTAPAALGSGTVNISNSSGAVTVNSQSLLTPAERLAVWQVISTGAQSIQLGGQGNAVGGTFNLGPQFHFNVSNLVIPQGVSSVSQSANLNIIGDLVNSGTFNVQPVLNSAASISATNIVNNVGALISSTGALNLTALQNIVNYGQINAAGNLTMTAGNSIVNSAVSGATLSGIIAAANVNLVANSIANSGSISALAGNLNINSFTASNLLVNNTLGRLSAINGDINVRDAIFTGKYNLNITGGDLLSKNLNLFSGNGDIDVNVRDITGLVNASAANIHLLSASPALSLGTIIFQEDPIFFNTVGGISINSAISGAAATAPALSIIAAGDITGTAAGSINAPAFPVNIIAGANITTSPAAGTGSGNTSGGAFAGPANTIFTINGPSGTGGKIDLTAFAPNSFTTSGNSGGSVTLVAFAGSSSGSGTINTGNIDTHATGGGAPNGNVVAIAGAKTDPSAAVSALTLGNLITSNQSTTTGGTVMLATGTPVITGNNGQLQLATVGIQGNPSPSLGITSLNSGSSIAVGSITANIAPVTILAGKNVNLNGSIVTGGSNPATAAANGNVAIYAGANIQSSATISINTNPASQQFNGGDVTLVAGARVNPAISHFFYTPAGAPPQPQIGDSVTADITVLGASSTGGNISIANLQNINTSAGALNGNDGGMGGAVRIAAFAGPQAPSTTGQVSLPAVTIATGGTSAGSTVPVTVVTVVNTNGDVSIVAGGSQGSAVAAPTTINVGNINTTLNSIGGSFAGNQGLGNITVATATPLTGFNYFYNTNAAAFATSTGSLGPSSQTQTANITAGSLTATGGSFVSGATFNTFTTSINVNAGNNLTIGAVSNVNNTLPAGGGGTSVPTALPSSSIDLLAGGVMTLNGNISSNAGTPAAQTGGTQGVDGGRVNIRAGSFTVPALVTVSANGTNGYVPVVAPPATVVPASGGNGGTITITSTNATTGAVTIGAAALSLSAVGDTAGGNGGTVTVTSAAGITLNTANLNVNPLANTLAQFNNIQQNLVPTGRGGTINLTAASTLAVTGNLTANGAGSTLNTTTPNVGNPGGDGGIINISVNSFQAFNVNGGAGPTTNGINGNITANGNIIAGTGNTAAYGSGGRISIRNLGTGGVTIANGALQVQAANATSTPLGLCCNPAPPAPPATPVPPNPPVPPDPSTAPYQIQPTYQGGAGGQIFLQGANVLSQGSLDASGGGSSIVRGGGDGGSIEIITNNSVTPFIVNPSVVAPPPGSVFPLVTTNGVIGSLNARGNVVIAAPASTSPFAVFSTAPVGSGGTIKLNNTAGSVVLATGAGMSVAAADANVFLGTPGGNGGSIIINAGGFAGTITSAFGLSANGGAQAFPAAISVTNPPTVSQTSATVPTAQTLFVTSTDGLYVGQTVQFAGDLSVGGTGGQQTVISRVYPGVAIDIWGLPGGAVPLIYTTNKTVQAFFPGGDGGTISLTTNSTFPALSINPATVTTNSIGGTLSANGFNGGTISITNNGFFFGVQVAAGSVTANAIPLPAGVASTIVNSFAGYGGTINIAAPLGNVSILGPLSANGGTGPNQGGLGGNLNILTNSSMIFQIGATGPAVTNGVVGALSALGGATTSAAGGDGGTITVVNTGFGGITSAANSINITPGNSPNGQGNGGAITLIAANGPVFVNGGLSANGGVSTNAIFANGNGGSITIVSNNFQPFNIGAGTTNGTTAAITANGWTGGTVNITNLAFVSGIVVGNNMLQVQAQAANNSVTKNGQNVGGAGGNITLNAPNGSFVLINGNLDASGGAQDVANSLPAGNGGQIAILASSYVDDFVIGGATKNGSVGVISANGQNGGVINISSAGGFSGIVVSAAANLSVKAAPGLVLTVPDPPNPAITFPFYGGKGGSIYLQATGLASGRVFISGTSGTGGLNVDGGAIGTGPGAGNGGLISITTNSTTAFNIGAAVAPSPPVTPAGNGLGAGGAILSAAGYNGGTIAIKNLGTGGITFNPLLLSVSSAAGATASTTDLPGGNGGTIDLQTPTGLLAASQAGILAANATLSTAGAPQTGANGGIINLGAAVIDTTLQLKLQAQNVGTGQGGQIFITTLSAPLPLTFGASVALNVGSSSNLDLSVSGKNVTGPGGTISINSASGINVAGALSTSATPNLGGGTINLIAPTSLGISQTATLDITTGTLNLVTGAGGTGATTSSLQTKVAALNVLSNGGNISVSNSVSLSVDTAVVLNPTPTLNTVSLTIGVDDGNLTITGNGQGVRSTDSVSLNAHSRTVIGSGNVLLANSVSGKTVVIEAIDNGTAGGTISSLAGTISGSNKVTLTAGVGGINNVATATGQLVVNADESAAVAITNTGDLLFSLGVSSGVGTLTFTNNGSLTTTGTMNGVANLTINTAQNQSIILGGVVGAGTATSAVTLNAGGTIVQSSNANVVRANAITLSSQNGNLGLLQRTTTTVSGNLVYTPSGAPLVLDVVPNGGTPGTLNLSTQNTTDNSNPGSIFVSVLASQLNTAGSANITNLTAGGDALISTALSTAGVLNLSGAATSTYGSLMLQNTSSANGVVNINANMTAGAGPVIVQNANTAAGTINVAAAANLTGLAWFFLDPVAGSKAVNSGTGVALFNGAQFPGAPVAGANPGGVTVTGTGTVFFGNAGTLTAPAATVNTGANVAFQGGSAGAIVLGNAAVISAPSSVLAINSLDLSNSNVVAALVVLQGQANSGITGTSLTTFGGTLNIDPTTANITRPISLSNVSSLNVPISTTLTFANFGSSNPVAINSTSSSTTSLAQVNGTMQFKGVTGGTPNFFPTDGRLFVNSNILGQVFTTGPATSTVSSDNNLTINAGGSITIQGKLLAGSTAVPSTGTLKVSTGQANPSSQSFFALLPANIITLFSPSVLALIHSVNQPNGTISLSGAQVTAGVPGDNSAIIFNSSSISSLGLTTFSANNVTLTIGGANFVSVQGVPVQFASSQVSGINGVTATNLNLNAGSGGSINLTTALNNAVANVNFTAADSPVAYGQATGFGLSGTTLNTGTFLSTSMSNASSIRTTANVTCSSCAFTANNLTNFNTITANGTLGSITITPAVAGSLAINAFDPQTFTNGTFFSNGPTNISSLAALSITGGTFTAKIGKLSISETGVGDLTISGSFMTAGSFNTAVPIVGPTLLPNAISFPGSIEIKGMTNQVRIADAALLQSIAGDIKITSFGPVRLDGNLIANGGNVSVLTTGTTITGNAAFLTANAVGTSIASEQGGRIELGALSSVSQLGTLSPLPGTVPKFPLFPQTFGGPAQPLGNNILINNNAGSTIPTGSVGIAPFSYGTINLGNNQQTSLNLYGGGIMLNAAASTASILFEGSSFTTNGYSPISFSSRQHDVLELDMADAGQGAPTRLAHMFVPGHSGDLELTSAGILDAADSADMACSKATAELDFRSGMMFLQPVNDLIIHADLADIKIKKGALVVINTEEHGLRVASCSGPGHTEILVGKQKIALGLGEEVVISNHRLSGSEHERADGIGRRRFSHHAFAAGLHASLCEISLFTVMTNWAQFADGGKSRSASATARTIAQSLLKTAAVHTMVTQSHGQFQARARERKAVVAPRFKPVNYVNREKLTAQSK